MKIMYLKKVESLMFVMIQICTGILKKFRFPNRLTLKGVVLSNQEINQKKEENQ